MTRTARYVECPTSEDTIHAGRQLAVDLLPGDCVLLEGDLAAGKTTFTRGIVGGLGGEPDLVSSPTFVIVQDYPVSAPVEVVHHVDLYRLAPDPSSTAEIGLEEMLSDLYAIVVVEWPREIVGHWLPAQARVWTVRIDVLEDGRCLEILPPGGVAA